MSLLRRQFLSLLASTPTLAMHSSEAADADCSLPAAGWMIETA